MQQWTLAELFRSIPDARVPDDARNLKVQAVQSDSREVGAGDVFVAVRGEDEDGRAHVAEAIARGAIVVVADAPVDVPVPLVLVDDARESLATLAAESVGRPADRLQLVGITGTVGKTSVLAMLSEILDEARITSAAVGSLGIQFRGFDDPSPNTTPGALQLQRAMARMVDAGVRVMAFEVTSHALTQERVHGICCDLGIFTNLAMLEHLEYHGSFRAYATAKQRFLDHLTSDAPLIYAAGDRAVAQLARRHPGPTIACGGGGGAAVTVRREQLRLSGTRIRLTVRRDLPRLGAPPLKPIAMTVNLNAIGRTNIGNAALAATAGLCLGAEPDAVRIALETFRPPRRRLEIIHDAGPIIIDDTVGHPDSITGVFELAGHIPHDRLHVVFCIRGQRGTVINERDAEAIAIWSRSVNIDSVAVTSATDSADERNMVEPAERAAFLNPLQRAGIRHAHHARLDDAIITTLETARTRDLVLLLGAQGMDGGAAIARRVIGAHAAEDGQPSV